MHAFSRRTDSLLLLALLLLTAACGDVNPPPPPPEQPQATLQGRLQLAPDAAVDGPVRLALAWYPGLFSDDSGTVTQPKGIVTEEVAYSGGFPVDFSFDVKAAPPAEALGQLGQGVQGRGAVGVLLAYRDRNGNASLDTIPATGTPVDQVVGASLLWTQPPAFLVVYLDSEQDAGIGLKKGFNLVRLTDNLTSEVVPLTTRIPLSLHEDPLLDAFVCEAAWDDTAEQAPCGILAGEPVQGVLTMAGSITLTGNAADVSLAVGRDGEPAAEAQVTVAGHAATYDATTGRYTLHLDDASEWLESGLVVVSASEGGEDVVDTLQVPADFRVTFPTEQQRVRPGGDVTVSWTASQGAEEYQVSVVAGEQVLAAGVGHDGWLKLHPEAYVGEAVVRVEVVAVPQGGGLLEVRVVRERPITFAPCDTVTEGSGLTVEGSFERYEDPGSEGNNIHAEVKDDGEVVTDATVTLNGMDVPYSLEQGAYVNGFYFMFGGGMSETVELRVARGGEEVCRTLTPPGDFELTLLGEYERPSGSPLAAQWTRSEGAVSYEYLLGGWSDQPMYSGSTNELEVTIERVDYVGWLGFQLAAVRVAPHSDTLGWMDVKRVKQGSAMFVQ